ncbi:MAG: UDP-N-acetylmuramoyl-tripeptide--D-alanyl-D-alanine ligase, partial [Pseudomonadota bacterium]
MTEYLWTSSDAATATGGKSSASWLASGISIDTRTLQPGDLFVALKDVRDGHDFVAQAFGAGASAALVSQPVQGVGGPVLMVESVLPALEAMGIAARARSEAVRVAVTGSVGKTSVKEMLAQIFRAHGEAHWPEKSFNNHWGVPLTLARMPQGTERAVFEIGMSTPGEIAPRSEMVRPHAAVITKIAAVHLEGVGTIEGVAEEKAGIFAGLESGGAAILPGEDGFFPFLKDRAIQAQSDAEILTFGTEAGRDARVVSYESDGHGTRASIDVMGTVVSLPLQAGGVHWATNAAIALLTSVATAKLSAEEAAESLTDFMPPPGRGQVEQLPLPSGGQFTLVDDAYNANPTSMRAALTALSSRPAQRRLVALGSMGELGPDSRIMHAGLAEDVMNSGAEAAWLSGDDMQALADALPGTIQKHWAVKANDHLEDVKISLCDGDTLLIKGSNNSRMGTFADALRQWSAGTDETVMDSGAENAARGR